MLFIVNPAAGAGRTGATWPQLLAHLRTRWPALDYRLTAGPGAGRELAREASSRYDVLTAVGGDGTVNEVASGILASGREQVSLGILPSGTGNDLAQQAGLGSPAAGVAALASGRSRRWDVVAVREAAASRGGEHYALNFAAVGFASELIKRTTTQVKHWFGPRLCYSVGFFRAWWSFRAPKMRVVTDRQTFAGPFFHVCAGNTEYAGGGVMRLSPGARPDDGQLDLCLIESLGRWETLWRFPSLLRGTHVRHPGVHYFRGPRLRVETDPPGPLQLDGELVGQTPADFQILPAALSLVAG
jgi:YegS/Rv2252/BmrU family lipid kinase